MISTGSITLGTKRYTIIVNSLGEICAFINTDTFPGRDWLYNVVEYFKRLEVAAVGGPALTSKEDRLVQRVSGYELSSFIVAGLSRKYQAKENFESDDICFCTFIASKFVLIY